jgi:sigma-B regulation protein RsbU (phosphoserine phosphatase)
VIWGLWFGVFISMNHLSSQNVHGVNAAGVSRGGQRYWIDVALLKSTDAWSVEMDVTPFVIGRGPDTNLRLDHDTVSRYHAQFYRDPFRRIWIRDLGSRNGIKVNDEKVSERLIEPGDVIRVGQFRLQVRLEAGASEALPVAEILPSNSELELSTFKSMDGSRVAVEHLSAILALGGRLGQTQDRAERARLTCELLVEPQLAGEAVWLLRVERERVDRPQMIFGPLLSAKNSGDPLHVSATLLKEVLQTGMAQMATNEPSGQVLMLSLPADVRLIAAAACPAGTTKNFIDVLYVIYPSKHATPEWLALTMLVANQFSQAEAMWAARRDLEARVVIEHDLKQASRIQKRLLPSKIDFDGLDIALSFEPCRWVGGDYVDVVSMANRRVLLAVADACGKGMQAALVASWVHTMVRTGSRGGLGLGALIDSMNEHLRVYLPDNSFVTFFALALDAVSGEFQYVNAGHPPALVLPADGTVAKLDEGSLPLGLEEHSTFATAGQLNRGELVVLYTDGWTDMSGSNGMPMGLTEFTQRVTDVWKQSMDVSAAEFIRRATAGLGRYARLGGNFADDRTILAVRRK